MMVVLAVNSALLGANNRALAGRLTSGKHRTP